MARNTQRFRRIGKYEFDDLLKDLRDFEAEMLGVKDGVDSGELRGPPGPPGVKGEPGDRSTEAGPAGPAGFAGQSGDQGFSAYDIAVNNGFEGTEEDWLESLQVSANVQVYRDDWGFIDADWGLVTDPPTSSEDYGLINE